MTIVQHALIGRKHLDTFILDHLQLNHVHPLIEILSRFRPRLEQRRGDGWAFAHFVAEPKVVAAEHEETGFEEETLLVEVVEDFFESGPIVAHINCCGGRDAVAEAVGGGNDSCGWR